METVYSITQFFEGRRPLGHYLPPPSLAVLSPRRKPRQRKSARSLNVKQPVHLHPSARCMISTLANETNTLSIQLSTMDNLFTVVHLSQRTELDKDTRSFETRLATVMIGYVVCMSRDLPVSHSPT